MEYGIGIDIGTTSICGILTDLKNGQVVRTIAKENCFLPTEQPWEKIQDAERILSAAHSILEELLCEGIQAIGITGQMHGIVYYDKAGKAVSPLYTWQDERGEQPYKDSTYSACIGCAAGYGHVTDYYNQIHGLVPDTAVGFCTIHDLFAMQLCGKATAVLHATNAASLGLFDLEENRFTCEFQGEVTGETKILGSWKGIPVSVAIGDNQASVLGALQGTDGILVNIGTGSQVSRITSKIPKDTALEVRPYFEGQYLLAGSALCGGRAFALLEGFFRDVVFMATGVKPDTLYPQMDEVLKKTKDGTLVFHNQFCGTRENPAKRGKIENLSTENFTAAEFMLGILKGTAEELYVMYNSMGISAKALVGAGNGIRKNRALMEMIEERFEMPLQIPAHTEEAAYGAMLFALTAAGYYQDLTQAQQMIHYQEEGIET